MATCKKCFVKEATEGFDQCEECDEMDRDFQDWAENTNQPVALPSGHAWNLDMFLKSEDN